MAEHVMQHPDSPTWCIRCGVFDIYASYYECTGWGSAWDCSDPETARRMFTDIFGKVANA